MKRKRTLALIITIALFVFCTSCHEPEEVASEKTVEKEAKITTHLKESLCENLSVDADITDYGQSKFPVYPATRVSVSSDKIKKTFFEDVEETELQEDQYSGGEILYHTDEVFCFSSPLLEYYRKGHMGYQQILAISAGQTGYKWPEEFSVYGISDAGDLDFMKKEKAADLVRATGKELGLSLNEQPKVAFAFAKNELAVIAKVVTQGFTEDAVQTYLPAVDLNNIEPCYYFVWSTVTEDGYDILNGNFYGSEMQTGNTQGQYLIAIVDEMGIATMTYSIVNEIGEVCDEVTVIGAKDALEIVKAKFDNLILNEPLVIEHISLCYAFIAIDVHENKHQLSPIWEFEIRNQKTNQRQMVFIDAVTGKLT